MNQLRLLLPLRLGLVIGAAALALASHVSAQSYVLVNAFPNLTFQDPVFMTFAPGTNRLYVAGRQGYIWSFVNSPTTTTKTVVLDLSAVTQGYNDSGLLGFAFHPQFGQAGSPNRGYIYVYYSYTPGPIIGSELDPPQNTTTPTYDRLSRFTIPDGSSVADPTSEVVLINQYDRDLYHNGGAMFFGPDGYLYLTNGDEGGGNDQYHQSQKIDSGLFSGVLRIDVDENPATSHPIRRQPLSGAPPPAGWPASYTANYYIPNDNPWQDPSGNVLEEFWAIGLRSPDSLSYDPVTGNILLTDVGQSLWEEIDWLQKGANYQWSYLEGFAPGPLPKPSPLIGNDTPPLYDYPHYNGDGCVVGGVVYRGSKFAPALTGQYIFGDYDSNRIWSMSYHGSAIPVASQVTLSSPTITPLGGYTENTSLVVTQLALLAPGNSPLDFGHITNINADQNGEIYVLTLGPTAQIFTLANPGQILNLSARNSVGPGQDLTAGFVVAGTTPKPILARGVGPALSRYGVTDVLPITEVQLFNSSQVVVGQNQGWSTATNASTIASTAANLMAFPFTAGSNDSAILTTVNPGEYTVQVSGPGGASGNAMVEVYDAAPATTTTQPQMINFSALGPVSTASSTFTAGFVIEGGSKTVLLRAVGPSLAKFGVANPVAKPLLTIFDSNGSVVATNSGWDTGANAAQIGQMTTTLQSTGAFALPSGSADAALLITLTPGGYTAQISGVNSTGEALFEIYGFP